MEKIGFIGLGKMGGGMAANLVRHGYQVTVYNRSQPAIDKIVELGAKPAKSSREVAEKSVIIITSLPNPSAVEQVICGPNGILEGARKGSAIIDTSTIDLATSQRIVQIAAQKGIGMLDAPVAGGGPKGAAIGKQSMLVGGKKEVFEQCKSVLNVLGNNVIHVGDNGLGLVAKLCFNMYTFMTVIAAAETFTFGVKFGVNAKTIHNIINTARGGDWTLERKCPMPGCSPNSPVDRDFEAEGPPHLVVKDIGFAMSMASSSQMTLLMSSLSHQMYQAMINAGLGDKDYSAVSILIQRLAGLENT